MGTIIRVRCTDQVLTYENTPVIASGGRVEDFVAFEFCSKWDGFVRTAVFWRSEDNAYHVLLDDDNTCEIPHEVLEQDGTLYFGVFGVNSAGRQRTTEVLTYRIVRGTITEGTKPTDPTPDIYTQLMAKCTEVFDQVEAFKAEVRQLVASKAPLDSPEFTGAPTSTTPDKDDCSTRIATTAFVLASDIDCGQFIENEELAEHNSDPDAHANLEVDGSETEAASTDVEYEAHLVDEKAHTNINLDGNATT